MSARDMLKKMIGRSRSYYDLFNTPDGKWVLNDILLRAGLLEATSSTGEEALRAEGRRSLALDILAETSVDRAKLVKRLQELADTDTQE